ncbi:hypothetical protein VTL71DRAFT_8136 [Oculimacula yallundae]|uniref:Uncharacterized protein n=1 Tax=Oculimacula yallundae TaxID=86028 RepID=A0ABR4CWP9_9HELO
MEQEFQLPFNLLDIILIIKGIRNGIITSFLSQFFFEEDLCAGFQIKYTSMIMFYYEFFGALPWSAVLLILITSIYPVLCLKYVILKIIFRHHVRLGSELHGTSELLLDVSYDDRMPCRGCLRSKRVFTWTKAGISWVLPNALLVLAMNFLEKPHTPQYYSVPPMTIVIASVHGSQHTSLGPLPTTRTPTSVHVTIPVTVTTPLTTTIPVNATISVIWSRNATVTLPMAIILSVELKDDEKVAWILVGTETVMVAPTRSPTIPELKV